MQSSLWATLERLQIRLCRRDEVCQSPVFLFFFDELQEPAASAAVQHVLSSF